MALALPKAFWPLTVTPGAPGALHVSGMVNTYAAAVAAGTYYSAAALAEAVRVALQAAWANGWAVSVGASGKITISASASFILGRTSGTNLALQSQTMDNAVWSVVNATVGANAIVAPDTTLTAEVITDTVATGQHYISQSISGLTIGATYAVSTYVKSGTRNFAYVQLGSSYGLVNMVTGTSDGGTATPTIVAVGLGWWRISIQRVAAATAENMLIGEYATSGTLSYTGTGTGTIYAWGAQVEPGAYPGPYAVTTTTTVGPPANAMNAVLGYSDDNQPSGTSATATNQHQNGWYADDPVQDDTGDLPYFQRGGRAQTVSLAGRVMSLEFGTRKKRTVTLSFLSAQKTFVADEAGTNAANQALERLVTSGWGRFRWWPNASADATYGDYALDLERLQEMPRNRYSPGLACYTVTLPMLQYA